MQKDQNYYSAIAAIPSFAGELVAELHDLEVAAALHCGSLSVDELDEAVLGNAVSVLGIEAFTQVAVDEANLKLSPTLALTSETAISGSDVGAVQAYFLRLLPQAREFIGRWFDQPSLRLLPQVAGEEVDLDIRNPGPVYISLLGESGNATWRSRLFPDEARVYPLSDGGEAIAFEDGHVVIDLKQYPADGNWRAFYLAQEDPIGCGEDERELLVLRRAESAKPKSREPVGKLIELILRGQLIDAWHNAIDENGLDDANLEVIVSMVFSQMEVLLSQAESELKGIVSSPALVKMITGDLKALPRLLDSFKQVLSEAMRKRMETSS